MSRGRLSARGFCVGDLGVSLELDPVVSAALMGLLEGVFGTLPVGGAQRGARYRVGHSGGRFTVWRDGDLIYGTRDPCSVVDCIELDIYDQWMGGMGERLLLHAGAAATEHGAVLLAGPSGSGKSTLTLRLCARGARLCSDEWVLIEAPCTGRGICRPIAFDGRRSELVPGWRRFVRDVPTPDGAIATWTLFHPPERLRQHDPFDVSAIVLLAPSTRQAPSLEPLAPTSALQGLSEVTLRGGCDLLPLLGALVDRQRVFRLVSDSPERAEQLLADRLGLAGVPVE